MSDMCWSVAFCMSMTRKSAPTSRAMISALERVRCVVPKQGMVTAVR